ncbi:hypothetical protein [Baaleninema simplex]|uniref:hypothetical protein n=1 Tax=Baaleninema simplex TaxID=2862350 RepID=UPI000381BA74|nr:hypothetical protein [Baaleninema simplex]
MWVDRIFPEDFRGSRRKDVPIYDSHWYEKGYIDYHTTETIYPWEKEENKPKFVDNVIIGYRSDTPWNLRRFLGLL